jgi:hypothetical protein
MSELFFPRETRSADQTPRTGTSLLALSLWIRTTFIGAAMSVAGLVSLIEPASRSRGMVVLATAGIALAAVAAARTRGLMRARPEQAAS